jgi:hypothetical protein
MILLVSGVGFFVPFVGIKAVLAQLMLRFERDDAFWVGLAGHCANIAVGAPLFALIWWIQNSAVMRNSPQASPSVLLVALFYAGLVIPLDIWTAQGIIRNGSYPDLDDSHPASTITQRRGLTTLRLVVAWSLVSNFICVGGGLFAMRYV